jgi:threonylcarbamoyladenosine tRNA methylthiotransferase MtaB
LRFCVVTFGCRVNQADSLRLESQLRAAGGEPVSTREADVVFVNTCSVTAAADQGARQTIRRIARENPAARIVATGCYSTRDPAAVAALPGVFRVVPNAAKDDLADLTAGWVGRAGPTTAERFGSGDGPCGASPEPGTAGRTAWTLRIQTGCDQRCSYCVVPATRGEPRSRPVQEVLRQLDLLVAAGFVEVTVAGVHLGSYGRDLTPPASLEMLLDAIARRDDPVLIRVSSLEPMDCTDRIVGTVAGSRVFAPHFHLPLQHACDRMLRMMRRPYSFADFEALVTRIRRLIPHAAIGSDVIAGFPGETDDDFETQVSFLERSPLSHLHVFPYSDRPGTVASRLPGKVHGAVVKVRAERLRRVSRGLEHGFRVAQVGTTREALTIEDGAVAVTDNYLKVGIPAGRRRNERIRVRISAAFPSLVGEVVD